MKKTLITTACLAVGLTSLSAQQPPNTAVPVGKLASWQVGKKVSVQLVEVASGLIDPINVASAKDGSGRLFVVERPGLVRIIKDGKLLKKPFLNIAPHRSPSPTGL